jgi:anti-sigma B factor antagonist
MKLKTREVYGAVIVDMDGQLVGGENSETFRGFIDGLLEQHKKRIIVNLHRVPWANSQGVGMLIGAHKIVKDAGGELVLANVTDKIHSILSVTRLCIVFSTFSSVNEAVACLRQQEYAPKAEQILL